MRPDRIGIRIFLDGGDPAETADIRTRLGFLDGQTTNPSLIANNPMVRARIEAGERFKKDELLALYRDVVTAASSVLPEGSISIEVYADHDTTAEQMMVEAKEMHTWIPNAHIKFPVTPEGLAAASLAVADGMRVNVTLCFTQEQAAAVHAATRGAVKGQVFVSPFIGRLDDRGENGIDLIANISRMYREAGSHVEVLAASIRTLDHLRGSMAAGADIATAPAKVLKAWAAEGMPDGAGFLPSAPDLRGIPYRPLDLDADTATFDIRHELTDAGVEKFAADWNALLS